MGTIFMFVSSIHWKIFQYQNDKIEKGKKRVDFEEIIK